MLFVPSPLHDVTYMDVGNAGFAGAKTCPRNRDLLYIKRACEYYSEALINTIA